MGAGCALVFLLRKKLLPDPVLGLVLDIKDSPSGRGLGCPRSDGE
jgi:hypothetical protein